MTQLFLRPFPLIVLLPISADAAAIQAGPWCGAVTSNSIAVTAHLDGSSIRARLAVSTSADFSGANYSDPVESAVGSGNNVRLDLAGLSPGTTYHYAVELDGELQSSAGRTGTFTTLPSPGPASFRFGFSSCTDWEESGQDVFDAIRNEGLLFFLEVGDLNYQNTNLNSPAAYRSNYLNTLNESPPFAKLARNVPTGYIWDDHDFSGDSSDRTSTGRSAHRRVYREMVPHYPLPAGGPDAAIYQTFDCGRVRFILSDLRSERDPDSYADNSSKSMMGAVQKQWFKDQLVAARDGGVPLIVWTSAVPFISTSTQSDNWGSYQTERRELLEFIRDENIRNLIIISGDMHALAYDDGRGTNGYVEGVRIPVFHAASLTRNGSEKGGPYSGGISEGNGRYATMDITDDGGAISVTYRGRIATSGTSVSTWKSHTHTTEIVEIQPASHTSASPALEAIQLTWDDISTAETGYRIERGPAGSGVWSTLATLPPDTTGYLDSSVAPATTYDYRVITLAGGAGTYPGNAATATSHDAYQNWRLMHLGDAAAPGTADDDNDGLTTGDEYLLDLNPNLPDRYVWDVSPPDIITGGVTVTFPTSRGRGYRVDYSHDLLAWLAGSGSIAGDGTTKQWTDDGSVTGSTPATLGKRYYRVVITEAP